MHYYSAWVMNNKGIVKFIVLQRIFIIHKQLSIDAIYEVTFCILDILLKLIVAYNIFYLSPSFRNTCKNLF